MSALLARLDLPPRRNARALEWRAPEPDESEQLDLFESPVEHKPAPRGEIGEIRRLVTARDDLRPLYVTGYNFSIGKSNDVLQVREKGQLVQEVRIREISRSASSATCR